jgi:ABC-type uncharacterized transport system ATPase subunit
MVVPSMDELIRIDLQNLRDLYFWWLLFCTGVVALGVLLEETEDLLSSRLKSRLDPSKGVFVPPFRLLSAIKLATKLGWILIIAGVVGEGVSEALVSKVDGLLTTFNTTLLSDAAKRSSDADVQAAEAKKRSGELEREAAELRKQNLVTAQKLARKRTTNSLRTCQRISGLRECRVGRTEKSSRVRKFACSSETCHPNRTGK